MSVFKASTRPLCPAPPARPFPVVAAVGVPFPQLTMLGERWVLSGERKCTALLDDFPEESGLGA
ncbi:hypothetical protein KPSA3_06235 [Pseudomonas syringae pv. actinidiae]|uniref:Uncharacterized protein n=1 Tax=Pseudomonas syringae pv. actinidiae TaxID=103796 RepID=A0AAN4QAV1_PSESF|nr:hypothetical protein KPSA3_06235 [Pseudomonas syringae pv. actinidiae]